MTAQVLSPSRPATTRGRHNGLPAGGRNRPPRHHPFIAHRECTPETAWLVEQRAEEHPEWLPRRHPEAKGRQNSHVGVRYEAPEGAYSATPVWTNREYWNAVTVPTAIDRHPDILGRHGVSAELLRRWARIKSLYAWSNGRRCIVRPDTLASVLGISERQVQRCNAAARELGLESVVFAGRMLTEEERYQAHDMGSRQRGLAAEVALTVPPDQRVPVENVTPPKRWVVNQQTHHLLGFRDGLTAEKKEAAPRPRPRRSGRRGHPAWTLAQQTIRAIPWLSQETPHRIISVLTRFVDAPIPWTGHAIAHALAAQDRRLGRPAMTAALIRTRPAVVLAGALRLLDPETDHPALSAGPLVDVRPAVACGHSECDGHGWLSILVEVSGYCYAVKCPRCHPSLRRTTAQRPDGPRGSNEADGATR